MLRARRIASNFPGLVWLCATLATCLAVNPAMADTEGGWPQLRGIDQTASVAGSGLAERQSFGLKRSWHRPLGSGYSAVVALGERAVTMFSDGPDDVLAAFDVASGDELWRYRVGDRYPAIGGSFDGPLSTPILADGKVYALGPAGRLFALRLADGKELWSRQLEEASEARKPVFGFSTAPVLAGDSLVVQTGGENGHSITTFDAGTGATRWSKGDAMVQYQAPLLMELDGREVLVAVNDELMLGLDPATGDDLWSHAHGQEGRSMSPTRIGERRVALNGRSELVALDLVATDGGYSVSEAWRSRELGRSYAQPVLHDGVLYGFTGRFLTALDADSGERLWKSRPPGGRGLILVDGHVAVVDSKGQLVLGAVSREGYEERARIAALGDGSYTAPSFAGGRFFVRNLEEIAALEITDSPSGSAGAVIPLKGALAQAVAQLPAEDRAAAVDRLLEERKLPWIEGDDLVHFLYRGEAQDVAVAGLGLVEGESQVALQRIEGTDLWARSVRVDPAARRLYRFMVDYDDLRPDPANDQQLTVGEETYSELRMPAWRLADHQQPAEGVTGRSEELTVDKGVYEEPRTVRVYLPAGYDDGGTYPLLLMLNGEQAAADLGLDNALDRLFGNRVEPAVVAIVGPSGRNDYRREADTALKFLTNDLLPALGSRYRLADGPANRALWGHRDGGYMALYAALTAPQTFGGAAAQGYFAHADKNAELIERLGGELPADLRLYVDWSRWDRTARVELLTAALDAAERRWSGGQIDGTSEWHDLAARIDQPLAVLLPAED